MIYEDGIYFPPDMIEKPGGLWITGSSTRPGESCSLQTSPRQPVVEASDSDLKLEELLRDTLEPGTPPNQSPSSSYETMEDIQAVAVDELQALVEELLPWLKDVISSSWSRASK